MRDTNAESASSVRLLLRIGGASAVVGGVLAIVGNVLHPRPRTGEIQDAAAYVREVTESGVWTTAHLLLVLAILLFLVGFVGLSRSFDGRARAVADVALVLAIVETTVHTATLIVDGVVMRKGAEVVLSAPAGDADAALQAYAQMFTLLFGLFTVWEALWGLPFIAFGAAFLLSGRYPWPLGAVAVCAGAGLVVVGVTDAFHGVTTATFIYAFPALAATVSTWLALVGVLLWRRAGRMPAVTMRRAEPEPASA
jgi:hypothetical protein